MPIEHVKTRFSQKWVFKSLKTGAIIGAFKSLLWGNWWVLSDFTWMCILWFKADLPFDLAFFPGFTSIPSKDLFLFGTPFKKLRPWMVGRFWTPLWLMSSRKAPFWDWAMFCWRFWAWARIWAHSWNPWAWARSAAASPLAFLMLHNGKTSVTNIQCTSDRHTKNKRQAQALPPTRAHTHTHSHTDAWSKYLHTNSHCRIGTAWTALTLWHPHRHLQKRWRLISLGSTASLIFLQFENL